MNKVGDGTHVVLGLPYWLNDDGSRTAMAPYNKRIKPARARLANRYALCSRLIRSVMRHRTYSAFLLLASLVGDASHAQSDADPSVVFKKYVALNREYLSLVEARTGKDEKSIQQLSRELGEYSDGPLEEALEASVASVCQNGQPALIRSLLELQQATTNSASESPATALGRMFVCQPSVFSDAFTAMNRTSQDQLYSLVEFGFNNAILDYTPEGKDIEALKTKLYKLEPSKQ